MRPSWRSARAADWHVGRSSECSRLPMIQRRPLGNVVAATDFSGGGDRALARAALLPMTEGATLTVMHVVPPQSAHAEAAAREALERAVERAGSAVSPGVNV